MKTAAFCGFLMTVFDMQEDITPWNAVDFQEAVKTAFNVHGLITEEKDLRSCLADIVFPAN